jgi:hypothetical protein
MVFRFPWLGADQSRAGRLALTHIGE